MKSVGILVISDLVVLREGIIHLLNDQPDMRVVQENGYDHDHYDNSHRNRPDIIILVTGYDEEAAINTIKAMRKTHPDASMILLTSVESNELMYAAFCLGVKGYIKKDTPISHFLASLRAISRGEAAISRSLIPILLEQLTKSGSTSVNYQDELKALTIREIEILQQISTSLTNREIAKLLNISENTVRVHVRNILKKLNLQNRRQAGKLARSVGLDGTIN